MHSRWQTRCDRCQETRALGLVERIDRLRDLGMLRQEPRPDPALVDELFRAASDRMRCTDCGAIGLKVSLLDDEQDDESWGMPRACADCGAPIPRERLELYPETRLCVSCQARAERGEASGGDEYCPRCGSAMKLVLSRGGITRYVMSCPACGRGRS